MAVLLSLFCCPANGRAAGAHLPLDRLPAGARRGYVAYALEHRVMFELMFRHDLLGGAQDESDRPRLRETTLPLFERILARSGLGRDLGRPPRRSSGRADPLHPRHEGQPR